MFKRKRSITKDLFCHPERSEGSVRKDSIIWYFERVRGYFLLTYFLCLPKESIKEKARAAEFSC